MKKNLLRTTHMFLLILTTSITFSCLRNSSIAQSNIEDKKINQTPEEKDGDEMDEATKKLIADFILCVKNKNIEKLSQKMNFPFDMEHPIPPIGNKADFYKRYDEIFDQKLTQLIVNSNIEKDWSIAPGWREHIMLHNGIVALYPDGKIQWIKYQSPKLREQKADLYRNEKNHLHPSVNKYEKSLYRIKTEKHQIHIDYMWQNEFGDDIYQFAYWTLSEKTSEAPQIVLKSEEYSRSSGGNEIFIFYDGNIRYEILIDNMDGYYEFSIYKDDKEIHQEYVEKTT